MRRKGSITPLPVGLISTCLTITFPSVEVAIAPTPVTLIVAGTVRSSSCSTRTRAAGRLFVLMPTLGGNERPLSIWVKEGKRMPGFLPARNSSGLGKADAGNERVHRRESQGRSTAHPSGDRIRLISTRGD